MDHNENAEWGPPMYCGAGIPCEPNTTGIPYHKMYCDLRFAIQSLQMAPPDAVAYYEPPGGKPLRLIVNLRQAREKMLWAVLLQDEAEPRILGGGEGVFITNMPGVLGNTMNEVIASCPSTQPFKSKKP